MHRLAVFIIVAAQNLDFNWTYDNTETSNEKKTCREQICQPKRLYVTRM